MAKSISDGKVSSIAYRDYPISNSSNISSNTTVPRTNSISNKATTESVNFESSNERSYQSSNNIATSSNSSDNNNSVLHTMREYAEQIEPYVALVNGTAGGVTLATAASTGPLAVIPAAIYNGTNVLGTVIDGIQTADDVYNEYEKTGDLLGSIGTGLKNNGLELGLDIAGMSSGKIAKLAHKAGSKVLRDINPEKKRKAIEKAITANKTLQSLYETGWKGIHPFVNKFTGEQSNKVNKDYTRDYRNQYPWNTPQIQWEYVSPNQAYTTTSNNNYSDSDYSDYTHKAIIESVNAAINRGKQQDLELRRLLEADAKFTNGDSNNIHSAEQEVVNSGSDGISFSEHKRRTEKVK